MKQIIKKFLEYLNFNIPSILNSNNLVIPVRGVGIHNLLTTEKWMPTLLTKINMTMPIGTLIDVGVNIGQKYIKFKKINKLARYVGFEPNPVCYVYSKRLLEVNNDQNSILLPVGLGGKSGLIYFYASTQVSSDGTMIEQLRHNNANITTQIVPIFRFDDNLRWLLRAIARLGIGALFLRIAGSVVADTGHRSVIRPSGARMDWGLSNWFGTAIVKKPFFGYAAWGT